MAKILIVVDVQNDFVNGSLGTKEAEAMLPALLEKVRNFDGELICTLDTHGADYLQTAEGKMLPVEHCIRGTKGWELLPALKALAEEKKAQLIEKPTFGSVALAETMKARYDAGALSEIELCGLCTDICVVSNALLLKAYMPELPIAADARCCAGVTPEKHAAALEVMRSCQITVKE